VPRSTEIGEAVFRLPAGVRHLVPRVVRESVRRRVGPFAPWEAGFDACPPKPAPSEHVGPPDFVGVGVQKAGTTWWYELVTSHPGVHRPPGIHKERHFFAPYATKAFGPDAVGRYHGWFPRPPGLTTGEWTPDYFAQPWVPSLLAEAAPTTRLLVMLRDPVERFRSGLAHAALHAAVNLGAVVSEAVGRGFYAEPLRAFLTCFAPEQVLVLQYEHCVTDPAGQLARTFTFLGLDPAFRPAHLRQPQSPTMGEKIVLDAEAKRRLVDLYRADVEATADLVGALDIGLWPNFGP